MRARMMQHLLAALAVCGCAASAEAQPATGARPNILLIISDDIGMDVSTEMYPGMIEGLLEQYGPAGHDHPDYLRIKGQPASTPVLSDLARQGMRFTNVWAHPFCSVTRAAIITGLFAAETKVTSYQDPLSQKHTTFVNQLREQGGYSTAVFGKWHLAGIGSYPGMKPKEAGFELFKGNLHAAIETYWEYDYHVQDADAQAGEWLTEKPPVKSLPGIAPTTYAPVVKVADAIEWITAREAEDDGPWFAWVATNLSHATVQRRPSQMAVPNADTLDAESQAEMRECGGEFGSANTGACSGEALMRAMTNSMDTVLGKLLEAVDALDTNTFVIYVGDNGTPMYGRPNLDFIDNMYITRTARGKGTAYEGGALVPMVVRGPGIEPGTENREFAHTADLYSTILDLAGLSVPETVSSSGGDGKVPVDAVSLAPILFGKAETLRDPNWGYILTETTNLMTGGTRQVGARNATMKVICTEAAEVDTCEFYDIANDPLEQYPLDKPDSCSGYMAGDWSPDEARWHFCRLTEVVASESFL